MARRPRVLFLCTGNACRSQMAEGWLRTLAGERFEALSAGTAPAGVDPRAVASMARAGVDIGAQTSDDVRAFLADPPDLVIAVCARAAESCPAFPGRTPLLRWPCDDPSSATGSAAELERVFADVCAEIRARIAAWLAEGAPPLGMRG